MQISIIIPAYNVEQYINQCIDSILPISLEKEIIIINDDSSDNTLQAINKYQSQKGTTITIINQENKGVAYARNLGIKIAKGDYISFIDPDDFVDTISYEKFIKKTIDNQLVIGGGNFLYYYPNDTSKIYPRSNKLKEQNITSGAKHFSIAEKYQCYLGSMCLYIFKKDFLVENALLCNEQVATYEDAIFMIQALAKAPKVQYFDINFYYYRQNVCHSRSTSKSHKHTHSLFTFIDTMYILAQNYKQEKPFFSQALYSRMLHILKRAKKFEKENYYTKYILNIPKYIYYYLKIKYLK